MSKPCKYCGKPISWVTTSDGARIPLDARPHRLYAEIRPKMWQRVFCYSSHLDTCAKRPAAKIAEGIEGMKADAVVRDEVGR